MQKTTLERQELKDGNHLKATVIAKVIDNDDLHGGSDIINKKKQIDVWFWRWNQDDIHAMDMGNQGRIEIKNYLLDFRLKK